MLQHIRLHTQDTDPRIRFGQVQVDETFIGGKARFMHRAQRVAKINGTGGMGTAAIMELVERHGHTPSR